MRSCFRNKQGQLGLGNYVNQTLPRRVETLSTGGVRVLQIAAGGAHSFVVAEVPKTPVVEYDYGKHEHDGKGHAHDGRLKIFVFGGLGGVLLYM